MIGRRDFLQVAAATATLFAGGPSLAQLAERRAIREADLLAFEATGQVTLIHVTDLHAQLVPTLYREPTLNIGVGPARGMPPHITGRDFLRHYGIDAGAPEAFAFTAEDFVALARAYGRMGGLDRIATVVKAIRAERPGRTLLLDGGDTWQGSYTALATKGEDMVRAMRALGVEAMTGHWEFTLGEARVKEIVEALGFPFLAGNVKDSEWDEDVFAHTAVFERGGLKIAVIGQAFPYTPLANPRWMIPSWVFGIREETMRERVAAARAAGADLVVVLSHNGFDVDQKMAARVDGIDVMLTGHTHDALPRVETVGRTLLLASGAYGKFVARLDLDIGGGRVAGFRHKLIPIFADAIRPDPDMARLVETIRAPHAATLARVLGRTETALWRRGNLNGTFDDLILAALAEERDAEITLSPGFRWGPTLLPGHDITVEDVYGQTAITYPNAYRTEMTGEALKALLEDVADNLFNLDPYLQQGGDMVRAGGIAYTLDVGQPIGRRVSDLRRSRDDAPIEPGRRYTVAGWGSVAETVEGPPIYELLARWLTRKKTIAVPENRSVRLIGA
ncbi:MAG: thiosulfohydrolase SoxB [Alphaproteobacteria bacterium]|nr:thiosulfohydrolase SoxB [Alphaproteobacteria bacterium]